ncbi:hypothetical protein DNTS_013290 [Danionella cerebrum]|uniref:Uncharacterized protein n=1 Tax=Danionella cerebrum TaxID=2873325 RepID=A0A553PWP0_9TELE|nr:hypothetical protein DNTS_013290 [Danionella translucida]
MMEGRKPLGTHYRTETRQLIQIMMREYQLTDFQKRQINHQLKDGGALPVSFIPSQVKMRVPPARGVTDAHARVTCPHRRTAERCRAGENYKREQFVPRATRDLEKEKTQLQNLLSTGQREAEAKHFQIASIDKREAPIDRFEEVLFEIEDRKQFLEEMKALGKFQQYQHLISSEITQKISELEAIDTKRSRELQILKLDGGEDQRQMRDGEMGDYIQ